MGNWSKILVQYPWIVFLLKITLVIAVGGLATTILAKGSASLRYRIWAGVFTVLALLPIIHFGFTGWEIPVVVEETVHRPFQKMPLTASRIQNELAVGFSMAKAPTVRSKTIDSNGFTSVPSSGARQEDGYGIMTGFSDKLFSKPGILFAIWFSGALFLFLRLIFGRIQAHQLFRRSSLLTDDPWSFVVRFTRHQIGLHQKAVLSTHPEVPIPLTFGTARPVVMLPKSANEWTMERRRIVLLHEFAHIRRRDDLTRLLARTVALLYWFHPLVWVAFRKFKTEQEKFCDERVICCGIRPSDYASHLMALARGVGPGSVFRPMAPAGAATLGMARKAELEGRLSEILNDFPHKETGMKLKIAGTFFVIMFGILLAVQPVAKAENTAPDPVVAVPAAPAKVAKAKTPATPKIPAKAEEATKPPKAPKAPKAPKTKKVMCKKIVTTVTDDGDGKVVIIKDGDKVQRIHVNAAGEKDEDNVIFLGDNGGKKNNVFIMKFLDKKYKTQLKAAIAELHNAMKLLDSKRVDLKKLNRQVARSMKQYKSDNPKMREQLKKAMAEVETNLKIQMKKNEAAMASLKAANKKLAEDMKHQQLEWVEKSHKMDAHRMEELAKREEAEARKIEMKLDAKVNAKIVREMKLNEIKEELANKHDGKVLMWVDEDDMDRDNDAKLFHDHGNHRLMDTDGDHQLKIKLKIELKGMEKKGRKAIDKALKKFRKSLPEGAKLDSDRDDNTLSLNLNVPKGTRLSDGDREKLNKAVEKLMGQIRDIKGDKDADIREIHIEKK